MKLFNTEFEVSMRILILLKEYADWIDVEKIIYFDFFTIYSKNYEITGENINGDSKFMLNDFTIQRKLFKDSVKELINYGLLLVKVSDGYFYKINNSGVDLVNQMNTDYSQNYSQNAKLVIQRFKHHTIKELKTYAKEMEKKRNNGLY